jgi:hypothetical protein
MERSEGERTRTNDGRKRKERAHVDDDSRLCVIGLGLLRLGTDGEDRDVVAFAADDVGDGSA